MKKPGRWLPPCTLWARDGVQAVQVAQVVLAPDAGPLITLAYARRLDALLLAGWAVHLVDMVLHEVTRNPTPTSAAIENFVSENRLPVLETEVFSRYRQQQASANGQPPRKAGLGEMAIQEYMGRLGMDQPPTVAVFLFEDHKIAQTNFYLPDNVRRVSTRAYLQYLEQKGAISSAAEIERAAVQNGRAFSQIRFP